MEVAEADVLSRNGWIYEESSFYGKYSNHGHIPDVTALYQDNYLCSLKLWKSF
jgi:hypothetical protein